MAISIITAVFLVSLEERKEGVGDQNAKDVNLVSSDYFVELELKQRREL